MAKHCLAELDPLTRKVACSFATGTANLAAEESIAAQFGIQTALERMGLAARGANQSDIKILSPAPADGLGSNKAIVSSSADKVGSSASMQ